MPQTIAQHLGPLEFELPADLEAHEPPEARGLQRDQVRLMVSHLDDDSIEHHRFTELPEILRPGDLVVANDSATVAAALTAKRTDGATIALHVSTRLPGGLWVVEPRKTANVTAHCSLRSLAPPTAGTPSDVDLWCCSSGGRCHCASARRRRSPAPPTAGTANDVDLWCSSSGGRCHCASARRRRSPAPPTAGTANDVDPRSNSSGGHDSNDVDHNEQLTFDDGSTATLLTRYADSQRLWVASFTADVSQLMSNYGRPIAYPYVKGQWPLEMYQTSYAGPPGSAEMPSAGRAFSPNVLEQLAHHGIQFVTLTLHTGVASLETHERPYAEEYWVPEVTARAVRRAKADGRCVIAVGTTVVRALESAVELSPDQGSAQVVASHAWTELMITPERGVRVVDSLLTGFHEPKATHLAMLEAIAGRHHLEVAYATALRERYLWHEFGDLHLILSPSD